MQYLFDRLPNDIKTIIDMYIKICHYCKKYNRIFTKDCTMYRLYECRCNRAKHYIKKQKF
jgi:hypothetical protein